MIEKGRNYGWPIVVGDRYPELRDNLLITTINPDPSAQRLLRVVFKPGTVPEVLRADVFIQGTYGRLRDVIQGPDGFLYLGTSNHDGRFKPGPEDDRVIRLLPVLSGTSRRR